MSASPVPAPEVPPLAPTIPPAAASFFNPPPPHMASIPSTSLYVGELDPTVTEAMLFEIFNMIGPVASIRVCRDALTRRSLGYAYVNYLNASDAERALEQLDYSLIKGRACRILRSQRDTDTTLRKTGQANIFVKNLDEAIDTKALHDIFAIFGNVLSCNLSLDEQGRSRGYGSVLYESAEDADAAIKGVNGMSLLNDKRVYVGHYISRKRGNEPRALSSANSGSISCIDPISSEPHMMIPNALGPKLVELGTEPTNLPGVANPATDDSFLRHGTYFFKDGNITFLVDGMLYCVHRYFFSRDSVYFSTKLAQLDIRDHEPLHTIVSLRDVERSDFEAFLSVIYPENFVEHTLSYEQWTSVLHLSTRWGFASLRELALKSIKPPTPFDQLLLARKYSVDHWIFPALSALCERSGSINLKEARQMSIEDVVLVATVREDIRDLGFRVDTATIPSRITATQSRMLVNGTSGRVSPVISESGAAEKVPLEDVVTGSGAKAGTCDGIKKVAIATTADEADRHGNDDAFASPGAASRKLDRIVDEAPETKARTASGPQEKTDPTCELLQSPKASSEDGLFDSWGTQTLKTKKPRKKKGRVHANLGGDAGVNSGTTKFKFGPIEAEHVTEAENHIQEEISSQRLNVSGFFADSGAAPSAAEPSPSGGWPFG